MTAALQQQLKVVGQAQVIVVLASPASSTRIGGTLESATTSRPGVPTLAEEVRIRETA